MNKKWIIISAIVIMFSYTLFDFYSSYKENQERQLAEQATENEQLEQEKEVPIGLKIGNLAPDFTLTSTDGETFQLSELRGQKVMLNFWATWCPPCRAEMPDMEKFYQNEDVVILAVNLIDTENQLSDVTDFANELRLTFPILLDEGLTVSDLYNIQPVPTSYMIDTSGIVQNVALGALNYEQMVQGLQLMN